MTKVTKNGDFVNKMSMCRHHEEKLNHNSPNFFFGLAALCHHNILSRSILFPFHIAQDSLLKS